MFVNGRKSVIVFIASCLRLCTLSKYPVDQTGGFFMAGKPGQKIRCKCATCGVSFDVTPSITKRGGGKYCSPRCKQQAERNREKIICEHCGASFDSQKSNKRRFCCHECYWNHISKNNDRTKVEINCLQCKKQFVKFPSDPKIFCSLKCSGKQRITSSTDYKCDNCGKTYSKRDVSGYKNKFCTHKCAYEYRHKSATAVTTCAKCGKTFEVNKTVKASGKKGIYCSLKCYRSGSARTYIENAIHEFLVSIGVVFKSQHTIFRYTCDFYVESSLLIIETDGDYWHSLPGVKNKDLRRDKYMASIGLKTLRLSETEIKSDIDKCKNKILNMLQLEPTSTDI